MTDPMVFEPDFQGNPYLVPLCPEFPEFTNSNWVCPEFPEFTNSNWVENNAIFEG
jgi:hypothetical protein